MKDKIRFLKKYFNVFFIFSKAIAVDFDSVIPQLSHYKTKEVSPRAWNIPLEFGNCFSIRVIGYKKVLT